MITGGGAGAKPQPGLTVATSVFWKVMPSVADKLTTTSEPSWSIDCTDP